MYRDGGRSETEMARTIAIIETESIDPEHEARGGLDVAVGEEGCRGGGNEGEDGTGDGMSGGKQDAGVVDESADDGGSGGDVGEQESSAGQRTSRREGARRWRLCRGRPARRRCGRSGRCRVR